MPITDRHEPGTPAWVDLVSNDLEAATRFYTDLFSWGTVDVPMPDGNGVYRYFTQDGRYVAAVAQQNETMVNQGVPSAWSVYCAGSVEETAARAVEAGGTVLLQPVEVGRSGRLAMFTDPGGAVLGVWEAGEHRGAGLVGEPVAMAWFEVNTRAFDACLTFYPKVFGWEAEPLKMPGSRYVVWQQRGEPVCGMLEMSAEWGEMPSHWMTYFAVANTDGVVERVRTLGGEIGVDPFDTPFGRVAVMRDPTGAPLAIISSDVRS